MDQETITLKEVLQWIDSPAEFSIDVVTANKQRDTGGEWLRLTRAWGNRSQTMREETALSRSSKEEKKFYRNPNHYENSTRNIRTVNGDIITIHIRLIRKFNGKIVL